MTKVFLTLFLLFLPTTTSAKNIHVTGELTTVLNWEGHNGHLIKTSNMQSTAGICPRNDFYILHQNHQFIKENYSLLLSARVSGKPITIIVSDDASNKCEDGFPRIFHLLL
ncbi:hypothetical protein [Grimontia sp. NTOU-MAR1]|uniref:hypothetical protein n=1 Tax=Grimontia sp. NTOU-MAR1 TaxID=3111011 RepID=UPI002DB6D36C|nr:hypothetical protein [Grimontia sp. NTOU-MAR1]WRV97717.1 hypothetical protein VP504_17045 [Grimontia sp. NTOU-MAR1]